MRKVWLLALVLLLGSLALAKGTLQIVWFTEAPTEQAILDKYIKMYEAANPDTKVEVTYVPFQQLTQKLELMVAGNTPPDVARVVTANIAQFEPVALDLSTYVDSASFLNQFLPSQIPFIYRKSRIIGAPLDVTANGLFYNKDCFAEAGVKAPTSSLNVWTWEQWREAMDKVRNNSKCRFALSYDFTTYRFSTLLYEAGGRYIDESGKKFVVDSPQGLRALTFFADLFKDGFIPKGQWLSNDDPSTLFRSGLSGMYMSGNWNLSQFAQIKNFNWGVMPLPRDKMRSTVPGGKFVMGFKNSKNPDEAAKFIQWITSKEINLPFSKDNMVLSARKDAKGMKYGQFDDAIAIYESDLSVTPAYVGKDWANPVMAQMNTFIRGEIVKVLLGQQTPKQALETIQAEGNKLLRQ
ncbi:ABC transporter substrate-binding protein [Meiothermus granaticius]|uniref:sn-glycerol-3-phosphate-binding periplasmic protein UgpB n=1 Tax=Meiothermus granaticius NBRC 107808 TaxID=1227551 RepID=A0A399FCV0_9DEIN|nr:sugar ABC transporter substrate-binding protein [Meiothermus granaticius]MCL6525810.1 sugar ABC transporter substrate-binding protein [Thermaceae bacterium]RIH92852.1 sn-glycerol-3-phosphate-binding periplasmic protein UgpB [Meiothermus granaticius NBRC 107808]GEM85566.1 sugar ABC transporter substrate-binding protein [Meiothermus granaticius NBRC 107808]